MSKYLALIKADLKAVDVFVNGRDEFDINIAAYHCQQAVEKLCGYAAQMNGLKVLRSHNITVWVEYLYENQLYVPKEIADNAEEIFHWESGSRYNINFVTARAKVAQIKTAVEGWLQKFEEGYIVTKKNGI
jgi:HEPN domain-containing protein